MESPSWGGCERAGHTEDRAKKFKMLTERRRGQQRCGRTEDEVLTRVNFTPPPPTNPAAFTLLSKRDSFSSFFLEVII